MKNAVLALLIATSTLSQAQTSKATFENQVQEILKHSDKEFKEIKGNAIPGETEKFESAYKIAGAVSNKIWETGLKYFIATFPETEDSTEAAIAFNIMEESVKKVLGDKATANTSETEKALSSSIYVKEKTSKYRKHDGESTAYYVLLELKKTSRDGFQFTEKVRRSAWTITVTIYQDLEF